MPVTSKATRRSGSSGGVVPSRTVTSSTSFRLASAAASSDASSVAVCTDASTEVTADTGV